jgi:hypothetical protein
MVQAHVVTNVILKKIVPIMVIVDETKSTLFTPSGWVFWLDAKIRNVTLIVYMVQEE